MDAKVMKRYEEAKSLQSKGDYIEALEILDDVISVDKTNSVRLLLEQATTLAGLAMKTAESKEMEVTYFFGALGCVTEEDAKASTMLRTRLLNLLGKSLGSVLYFKKCVRSGRQGLAALGSLEANDKEQFERLVKEAELRINFSETCPTIVNYRPRDLESKESQEPRCDDRVGELRSYWKGLDVKVKRDFMKVSIEKLTSFVKGVHKKEGLDVLKNVLDIAREHRTWTVWVCRTKCDKVCFSVEECKTHLEEKHAADFKTSSDLVNRLGRKWADKIEVGPWEPLDTAAAVEMISTRIEDVKEFTDKNRKKGWSKEWPVAADEKRSSLLNEVKLLLLSLCEHQVLSFSIRDWVMSFPVKQLREFGVSEERIKDCHLVETPQSICFLERDELSHILAFLKNIKWERHDGTDYVCRAVESMLDSIRIKESIEFDEQFSLLLLDKRLLKKNKAPLDVDGKIKPIKDPESHYANAKAQGDDMISWLVDYSSVDKSFPKPIREHNLDIWVAVLRALQYTCRALGNKYEKKKQVLDYQAALTDVENLCMLEDERNSYASLLCKRSEEGVKEPSLTSKFFLCAVRDVLHEDGTVMQPTFDLIHLYDCLNLIRKPKSLSNDTVLKSIGVLKSMVTEKVLLIDAKILLIDNSRIRLLDKLTRLSAFDNRSYMLHLLKPFLMNEIVNMESKAKSDAAEADLLLEEEKKSQAKKTQKDKSIKTISKSVAKPVDKTVEHESSAELEPEEDSKEPERGRLETLSNADIQVEATTVEGAGKNEIVNMESKAKSDAAEADLILKEEKKSQAKNTKKDKSIKITSTSMAGPVEQKPSTDLAPGGTSQSPKTMASMEPKDTLTAGKDPLEISSTIDDMQSLPGEDSVSGNLESALGGSARYNSALDMTLKALVSLKFLKEDLKHNKQPFHDDLEEQVPCELQSLFSAVVSEEIKTEGVYSLILSDLLVSLEEVNSMSNGAAEVLVTILESWHCWENEERESLVDRLFTLEENERMSCRKCRRQPNYPEQSSYGIVMAADSIRDLKCAFRSMKFVDILKVIRMEYKMVCDIKSGGCGTTNFVHHVITRCPPVFTIVLEWEKSETEKEISETTKALEWEIDISRLYEGLEPNTHYRLVSMVGCSEEEGEHICMAYEKNRWVNLRRDSLAGEVVGNNWKNVVRFCGERKVRPVILFYEAAKFP